MHGVYENRDIIAQYNLGQSTRISGIESDRSRAQCKNQRERQNENGSEQTGDESILFHARDFNIKNFTA